MSYTIDVVDLPEQPVFFIQGTVAPADIGDFLANAFPRAFAAAGAAGLTVTGMPYLRYLGMSDKFVLQAGVPVSAAGTPDGDVQSGALPGGKTATTLYLGQYDGVGVAWEAMRTWLTEQGLDGNLQGWDVYENDPTTVSDPSEIRTRIFCPLPADARV